MGETRAFLQATEAAGRQGVMEDWEVSRDDGRVQSAGEDGTN